MSAFVEQDSDIILDGDADAEKVVVSPGIVLIILVAVKGTVLSDSVDSSMLKLEVLESGLDIDDDRSISSGSLVDSETDDVELVIDS